MVFVWMTFRVIIPIVSGTLVPVETKLVLGGSTLQPVIAIAHCFELLWDNSFVGNTDCCSVVALNWGGP